MKQAPNQSIIIHLNGMPGVGKFTVAKYLAKFIKAKLIDNHLLIDLAVSIVNRGSSEYKKFIMELMDSVLHLIPKRSGRVYIFTNSLTAEYIEDRQRFEQIKQFAEHHDIPFIQILLDCDWQTNKLRLVSKDRKVKSKLTDPIEFEKLKDITMYHPPTKHSLIIDTTHSTAEETATKIKSYLESFNFLGS